MHSLESSARLVEKDATRQKRIITTLGWGPKNPPSTNGLLLGVVPSPSLTFRTQLFPLPEMWWRQLLEGCLWRFGGSASPCSRRKR